ncbi:MAG TPA: hypothetical protein PKD12_02435 [Nitrospira sp.]|nr:hypothetical protein [Nitrospira sp.]
MSGERGDEPAKRTHLLTLRWKLMLALGTILILLGACINWAPPQEAGLLDTSSFLVILGMLLGFAGLLIATRR